MQVAGVILLMLATGAAAGLLAGLLGVGGGLIIVAALAWQLPALGVPHESVMHVALATALASMLATSLASSRAHARRGSVMWESVAWLVPGLLLGTALGTLIADRLATVTLAVGVALYCFVAAAQLAFGRTPADDSDAAAPRGPLLPLAGVVIGAVSALVGIGGGSMTVPLLIARGARPVRAIGSSAACGFAIALAGMAGYVLAGRDAAGLPAGSVGYVFLPGAIAIALASVAVAPAGVALAHRTRGVTLKRLFAGLLLLMGVSVLVPVLR